MKLEHAPEWPELGLNHLEGRTAGFYVYGDDADDERDDSGRPVYLEHPDYFDPQQEPYRDLRDCYAPLVWQCRFSGIEVPDALWHFRDFGKLFWRERAMRVGHPPADSSPQAQQAADLNQDARLFPQQSEGERLRK